MKITAFEEKTFNLADELRRMAEVECQNLNPDGVHYLISELRRLQRLPHIMKMKGLLK